MDEAADVDATDNSEAGVTSRGTVSDYITVNVILGDQLASGSGDVSWNGMDQLLSEFVGTSLVPVGGKGRFWGG